MESSNQKQSLKILTQYLISCVSFALFVWVLTYFLNIELFTAVGFSVLLLIHELGHVVALKQLNKKVEGMYFLPFLGAIVTTKDEFKSLNEYAYFKYLGPLLGTLGVLMVLVLYYFTNDTRLLGWVYGGAIVNGINMIPITLLDGYGILKGVSKHFKWLGLSILIVAGFFILKEYTFTLFFLLIFTLFSEDDVEDTGYKLHEITLAVIFILGMILVLAIDYDANATNIVYIVLSFYVVGVYLKSTLWKDEKVIVKKTIALETLTYKEKYGWGIRWFLLSCLLVGLIIFTHNLP